MMKFRKQINPIPIGTLYFALSEEKDDWITINGLWMWDKFHNNWRMYLDASEEATDVKLSVDGRVSYSKSGKTLIEHIMEKTMEVCLFEILISTGTEGPNAQQ